jgi:hypothetical protein
MIALPSGVRVWIAAGHSDMRRGMHCLALQVQEVLTQPPERAVCTRGDRAVGVDHGRSRRRLRGHADAAL